MMIEKKHRETIFLNQNAIDVLQSNQILHKYNKLPRGARRFLNKAIRINQEGRAFTVSDFPEMKKSMPKRYAYELRKAGFIETLNVSGYAYYRVIGFRLNNYDDKLTPNPTEVRIREDSIQDEIFQILEEYFQELDSPVLHNIRLHFHDDFIYQIIRREFEAKNPYNMKYNSKNKSFTIDPPIFGFEKFKISIILTPTKLIQVLIKNTFNPISVNETGLFTLVCLLGEIRYHLCRYSNDIPKILDWIFVRADFGRDCKKPLNKLVPNMQFKHISGALMRIYSKKWEDGSRKLRVEKIISPNKSMKNIITNILDEPNLD